MFCTYCDTDSPAEHAPTCATREFRIGSVVFKDNTIWAGDGWRALLPEDILGRSA